MTTDEKIKLLYSHFSVRIKKTANQVIDEIYYVDTQTGSAREGWKFYVHLNKLLAPMAREGMIEHVGYTEGPSGRDEKLWVKIGE